MPLDAEQSRQYTRAERLDTFFEHEQATVDLYVPMKDEVEDFRVNFKAFQDNVGDKNTVTTGITKDKNELKKDVADQGELICNLTHVFAVKYNHNELAAKVNYNHDEIFRLKDANIKAFAEGISTAVSPFVSDPLFAPYGIIADTLSKLKDTADAFTKLIGKAKEGSTHNTVGDTEINKLIGKIIKNIESMDKLLVWFQKDHSSFVEGYHLNSALDHTGIRHNGIQGVVKDVNDKPIAGAVIRLRGTEYVATTDLNGAYKLTKVKAGDYIVEVTAEGYVAQEGVHHIGQRKIEEVDFVMKEV